MDAAAAFVRGGFTAAVALEPGSLPSLDAEVVALCTHSRHDSPGAARRKVRRACARLRGSGRVLLFKKLDSTAQGNVVAEVEAARDAGGFALALVSPAHPAQGRKVRGSVLRVRGGGTVDLAKRFRVQGLRKSGEHRFRIADATSERDLERLVGAALRSRQRVLLAGSAGMAAVLAKLLRRRKLLPKIEVEQLVPKPLALRLAGASRGVLIFAGSTNPVTNRQLAALIARTRAVSLALNRLTRKNAAAALASGRHVVIRAPVHRKTDRTILRQLGALTPLLRARLAGGLLLTGGDTAALVCRWLRPRAIVVNGEIAPGLAWGRFVGGAAGGLAVCTKPGGFGRDQSLARAVSFLASAPAGASSASA